MLKNPKIWKFIETIKKENAYVAIIFTHLKKNQLKQEVEIRWILP